MKSEPSIIPPDKGFIRNWAWNESKVHAHGYLIKSIRRILDELKMPKTAQILDVGCGGGYILHELYTGGYRNIWGFDIAGDGIMLSKYEFSDIKEKFAVHDGYDKKLPESFPSGGYDLVLSIEVIEHLYSPKKYLENINYWLKEKGYLIVTTPYNGYLKTLAIALLNKFDLHFNPLWEGGHIKFFSKHTLYTILEDTAFKPVGFFGSGRFPYLWKSMVIVAQKIG
jgi:2-polyprenyl-3-methyl-5-hydroxy-6-metoxy-1,4-benzoquinol methylase